MDFEQTQEEDCLDLRGVPFILCLFGVGRGDDGCKLCARGKHCDTHPALGPRQPQARAYSYADVICF